MKKNQRRLALISAIILMALFVPLSVVAAVNGNLFAGRDKPPTMQANESENAIPQMDGANVGEETILINGEKTQFLLDYLNGFKIENLPDSKNTEEATRVTRKNVLLQEYRTYVEKLCNQEMTVAEYETHYEHLMSIYQEVLLLEPEETPDEAIKNYINRLLLKLEDELAYCEHQDGSYVKNRNIDVVMMREALADLTSLNQTLLSEVTTYEAVKEEYFLCLEKVKTAMPDDYAIMLQSGLLSENL